MDIIAGIIPVFVEYTVAPVIQHASYPFKCKSNIKHRNKEVDELKKARERVQRCVDEDERNGRKIHRDVKEWLVKVDGIIVKVEGELVEDEGGAKKRCFVGLCPDFKTRYQLSKKAEDEAMVVLKLQKEREGFDTMSYRDVPEGIGSLSVKDYEALQSRMSIFNEIMDVLTVGDVNIIGVHGMGGVGKTTLVEQIVRQVKKDKLFNEVVMVVVTQTPDVKNIQEQIAEQLGLKFDEESERVRADRLCERLKEVKKILVVLDDLWRKLDLEEVGIPCEDEHKGCKILVTSRELDVLSSAMDSQKNFSVRVLPEEEAWDLFKKMAGDNFENQELQTIATKVAKECAGLPVAIVTVSRALKNKSLSEWRNALRQLQRPSSRNFVGLQAVMYSTIQLSYNHLESEELKHSFLLCSLMGYNATTRELLKYGMGLGLFPDIDTFEEAQDRVHSLVDKLRASCLLLDSDTSDQFAMHDVVRDVAISIASRDHHVFSRSNEAELKWPDKDTLKKCKQIWLHCRITELLEELECLHLDLFRVDVDDAHVRIPENFFRGMQGLKVLDLKNFSVWSLPSSLCLLENLRTLCLDQFGMGDIAIVGELKNLEILSFVGSDIVHLPKEIGQLTKLKLLDLTDCSQLELIPPNVLSRLSLLQELYMGNSFDKWEIQQQSNRGRLNASLTELKQLSQLTNLEVHIPDAHTMPNNLFSNNLRRYKIFIGDIWGWKGGVYDTLRTLKLRLNSNNHSEYGIQMLLKGTEDLYLNELKGVKNILYELDREGFPQLKHLHLNNNPQIQHIISTMRGVPANAFPKLESFFLYNLVSLEKICHGELREQPFRKLRVIEVRRCHKLKHLFSSSVARVLLQLQSINLTSCENMREIVDEGSDAYVNKNEVTEMIEFPALRSLSLKYLPQLKNFNEKIAFPNLEELELNSINIEWHVQLPCIAYAIQNLTRLVVYRCVNMKYLIITSMIKSLMQLKYLDVSDCKLMEEIIGIKELGEERMIKILFPKLEVLQLSKLPKLTCFCTAYSIECPLLKRLSIQECPQLKRFISDFTSEEITVKNEPQEVSLKENHNNVIESLFDEKVVFPSLAELKIYRMDNLGKIWHNQLAESSFCELKSLVIDHCKKLVNIFPSIFLGRFQRLEKLTIRFCDSSEEIFDLQELSVEEAHSLVTFHLKDMRFYNLPKLKHIWNKDPQGLLTFENLHAMSVSNCQVLKSLLPFSITRDLLQLEELEIVNCGIEEIVWKQESLVAIPSFVFHRLSNLRIREIPNCRSFYPGIHTWQCPMLKRLDMYNYDVVKLFTSEFLNFKEIEEEGQLNVPNQQPLVFFQKVIPNLEELLLDGKHATTSIIWQCLFPEKFIFTLKVLNLHYFNDKSIVSPFGFLQKFCSLEKLAVADSSFKNIFSCELSDEQGHTGTLARLRNLEIDRANELRHVWKPDHRLIPDPNILESLRVWHCDVLINLAPSSASFQNLTTLDIYKCKGLSYLVTLSTAKSLVQLIELEVDECDAMIEIVGKQEDELKDEIVFSKLERLKILELRSLTSFCSRNCTVNFPSLKEVVVEKCPNMRIFSPGVLSTPKLQRVYWENDSKNKVCWDGSLNNTIKHLYTKMVGFSGLEDLKLSEFPQLKAIWHGELPVKFFSNLESLLVDECAFFSNAVPPKLLKFLDFLQNLEVRNCSSLEGVFDLEGISVDQGDDELLSELSELHLIDLPQLRHIWNKDPKGILDFTSLRLLEVHNCSELRNIFTPSMALALVRLQKMDIRNCAKMEEIIKEERSEQTAIENIEFPELEIIILESLPNLTSFYLGSGILEFPSLKEVSMDNSPPMKTFFSSFLHEQGLNTVDDGKGGNDICAGLPSNSEGEIPPTPMAIESQISLQVQNDPLAIDKDIQEYSVIHGKGVPQANLDDIDCSIEVTGQEETSDTLDSACTASASSSKSGIVKQINPRDPSVTINKLGDEDRSSDAAMDRSNNDVDSKGVISDKGYADEADMGNEHDSVDGEHKTFQQSANEGSISFNGFEVCGTFVPYLIHIQSVEGAFWDVGYKRNATISCFLTSIGEVMKLLDKRKWGALSKEELEFVATSISDALQGGFRVNCLRPMMERANELLALSETQSEYEILMQELRILESRIESLRANAGDLAGKLKSKEVISDMRCLCGFYD